MKKIIAVLTQKGSLSTGIQKDTTINLFEIENELVKGVENVKLENIENNYFSLLMSIKKVSLIYIGSINTELKNILKIIGIATKCRDEIGDDKFINQFIFD